MKNQTNKISYLDGIRGLAALFVFFHHFFLVFATSYYNWDKNSSMFSGWDIKYGKSAFSVFTNGNFCVCLFFVLSGFVLSRKYYYESSFTLLVSAAQRRFVRLYIPVASTIILAYVLMQIHIFSNPPVSILTHSEWWFGGLWTFSDVTRSFFHCLLYTTMLQGNAMFDTTLWTMNIEFYNSFAVFAFLALTHKVRRRFLLLLVMLYYCYLTDSTYLGAFMIGIGLNYFEDKVHLQKSANVIVSTFLLVMGLLLGSYPSQGAPKSTIFAFVGPTAEPYFNMWAHIMGALFVIAAFLLSRRLQRFISGRFFRFLGYISFSLYLLHPLVMGTFSSYLFLAIHSHLSYGFAVLIVWITTTGVCFLVSWLMTRYIDDRGVRLAKYIYTRYIKALPSASKAPDVV